MEPGYALLSVNTCSFQRYACMYHLFNLHIMFKSYGLQVYALILFLALCYGFIDSDIWSPGGAIKEKKSAFNVIICVLDLVIANNR